MEYVWATVEKGFKISIPKNIILDWIKLNNIDMFEVDCKDRTCGNEIEKKYHLNPYLTAVAYTNTYRISNNKEDEIIKYGTVRNTKLKGCINDSQLTGYIKDEAWSYEKEIRLCVEFNNITNFKKIALSLPESILDNITLTPSPLYGGDYMLDLNNEINRKFNIKESLFYGKIQLKAKCEDCCQKSKFSP